ncbi:hypothetical protein [Actinoplanes sp. NPDC049802]|uniref:hypothetical protein n=1 Tax=Actinoplanes sp. NPDC049802 TaxID=3154742 RepID=UPI0033D0B772
MTISIGTSGSPSARDTHAAWLRRREDGPAGRRAPHGPVPEPAGAGPLAGALASPLAGALASPLAGALASPLAGALAGALVGPLAGQGGAGAARAPVSAAW